MYRKKEEKPKLPPLPPPPPPISKFMTMRPVPFSPRPARKMEKRGEQDSFESVSDTKISQASLASDKLLLHDTVKCIATENSAKRKYRKKLNRMIIIIILLSNLFSSLVTFITTREIYSVKHPPHDAGVISLQYGEKAGHRENAGHGESARHGEPGHGERAGQGMTAGRAQTGTSRGDDRDGGTTRARIDISVDGRTNTTKTLELSPMWYD